MITERTLKKWRKEALQVKSTVNEMKEPAQATEPTIIEWQQRILRMTQELLDQHLLRKR